jgi:hypothetical protein
MWLRDSRLMAVKTCSKTISALSQRYGKSPCFSEVTFLRLLGPTYCQFCPVLMERKTWSVHFGMETSDKPVQNQKKKRSQSDKIGRLKYNQQLLKQTLSEVEEVKLMLRTIFAGLKGSFNFEKSLIERIACSDEVDQEIIQLLYEAGSPDLLPKDLQAKLERFRATRHQISRRIHNMNKRLEKEFGEQIAEKRGWHWALTSFTHEIWGEPEKTDN